MDDHSVVLIIVSAILLLLAVWGGVRVVIDWKEKRLKVKRDTSAADNDAEADRKRYERIDQAQAAIDEQQSKLFKRMQSQITFLEESYRALHRDSLEAQARIEVLSKENGKCEERCAKLERDHDDCKKRTARLEAEVTILKGGPL